MYLSHKENESCLFEHAVILSPTRGGMGMSKIKFPYVIEITDSCDEFIGPIYRADRLEKIVNSGLQKECSL